MTEKERNEWIAQKKKQEDEDFFNGMFGLCCLVGLIFMFFYLGFPKKIRSDIEDGVEFVKEISPIEVIILKK